MRERSLSAVKIIGVANHPALIRKRVEFAKRPEGYRDRDKMDEMLGVIRTPHGATFIDKFISNERSDDDAKDEPEQIESNEDFIFPDASEIQERIQPIRQRMLEAGK